MSDQLQDIVGRMMAAGESEEDIAAVIRHMSATAPVSSHDPVNTFDAEVGQAAQGATGISRGSPVVDRLREAGQFAKQHAPALLAAGVTAAVPPLGALTIPAELIAAGGGGYLGARVRGDERGNAAVEGITQAGMQAGGRLVQAVARPIARGFMKGGMPKNIKAEYGGNKVADAALDTGAIPGSQRSADRIARLSSEANQRTTDVAKDMAPLSRKDITAGFREPFEEASTAKMSSTAQKIAAHTREVGKELKGGISAEGALTRKRVLQRQGQAALNNPDTGAFMPQLKDTERATITKLLRRDPAMAESLNNSQAMMGLDDFMKDSLHSNPLTRLGGGVMNIARSPTAFGLAAHGVDKGGRAVSPQMLRAVQIALLRDEQ